MNYFRNTISKLLDAISAPGASTCNFSVKRLQDVCDKACLLYPKST